MDKIRLSSFTPWLLALSMVLVLPVRTGHGQALPDRTAGVVNHGNVYARALRAGDAAVSRWPEVTRPMMADPGAALRLLHPNGTEEVLFPLPAHQSLVDAPLGQGMVLDPNVAFDGRWVVFASIHDQRSLNIQGNLSRKGARFDRCGQTGQGENCPNFGVFNVGPAFVARVDPARTSSSSPTTASSISGSWDRTASAGTPPPDTVRTPSSTTS